VNVKARKEDGTQLPSVSIFGLEQTKVGDWRGCIERRNGEAYPPINVS
jgi:hypothetical protein